MSQSDDGEQPPRGQPSANQASTEHVLSEHASSNQPLSEKETREIVTPYAFQVSPSLLGTRLATPMRRGMAQIIDLILIAMLSGVSALLLAFFAAITFIKSGSNLAHKPTRSLSSKILKAGGAILLFMVTFAAVDSYQMAQIFADSTPEQQQKIAQPILQGVNKLAWGACDKNYDCYREVAEEFGQVAGEITDTPDEDKQRIVKDVGRLDLTPAQQQELTTLYQRAFDEALANSINDKRSDSDVNAVAGSQNSQTSIPTQSTAITPMQKTLAWIKGVISDLGLGFGWAALYYSVFTAWFKGRTPGKWVTNIRVVRLDGNTPTLWESFGRYGGYGAGLATGLLGFLQIYWDPNRQAIQDKIAETLVIYEKHKAIKR